MGVFRATGLLLFGVFAAGCQSPLAAFYCTDAESCGVEGAICEPDRLCSLPDDGCPSGRRYSDQSGTLSGRCTGEAADAAAEIDSMPRPDARQSKLPDSGMSLTCDSGFSYSPDPAIANQDIQVDFTDSSTPWTFVEIEINGPGGASRSATDYLEGTEWTWRWTINFDTAGVYSLTVTQGETPQDVADCQILIE